MKARRLSAWLFTLPGLAAQFFFGWFADWREGLGYAGREKWEPAYYVCAGMLALAGLCWLFVDPTRRVEQAEEE